MTTPEFLTTKEVAGMLRVKERKVYDMVAEGGIPHRRITGKLLFPRAELEAWLSGKAVTSTSAPNVIAGSHDPLLDWAIRQSGSGLATLFDGSMDGIDRLVSGDAGAAGMHVYEPETGDWNLGVVKDRLGAAPVVLIEWAKRQQGLIVAPDLAGVISRFADLAGRRVAMRQDKAGAAVLFNHLLGKAGFSSDDLRIIPEIARTETEAAAAIAAGQADVAPGLEAAARQFGLGFVPTMIERFDLAIERRLWFEAPFQQLLAFAQSQKFSAKAVELGGYDISQIGRVVWNGP